MRLKSKMWLHGTLRLYNDPNKFNLMSRSYYRKLYSRKCPKTLKVKFNFLYDIPSFKAIFFPKCRAPHFRLNEITSSIYIYKRKTIGIGGAPGTLGENEYLLQNNIIL